jgi:FkbM family methyltransferase
MLTKLAGILSERCQQSIKRFYYARQIRRGVFRSEEPDYIDLDTLVSPGDWVIDVGANIGHYTLRLSQLVQASGRVFAFEPIPLTFELLAANCALSSYRNVTLFNAAASNTVGLAKMEVPVQDRNGRLNYYEARISNDSGTDNSWCIFTLKIDSLDLAHRVSLVKVDAEGHELQVVQGMLRLIECHHPVLVVEGTRAASLLESLGYRGDHRPGSPNYVWRYHPVSITVRDCATQA